MSYANLQEAWIREIAATTAADTDGTDGPITISGTVTDLFVFVTKTAEANADNLLTVRLQGSSDGSTWVDLPWTYAQLRVSLTAAADSNTDTTKTPNIVDASSGSGFVMFAYYQSVLANELRSVWIASGTAVSHTFSVLAVYREGRF